MRGIIAGKFKRSLITTANDLYNCQFFQAGISQRKIVLYGILGQLSGSTFVWCGGEGNRIPKPQVQCFAPSDPTPCTLLITLKKL